MSGNGYRPDAETVSGKSKQDSNTSWKPTRDPDATATATTSDGSDAELPWKPTRDSIATAPASTVRDSAETAPASINNDSDADLPWKPARDSNATAPASSVRDSAETKPASINSDSDVDLPWKPSKESIVTKPTSQVRDAVATVHATTDPQQDDLTKIAGVSAETQRVLRENGIERFEQLAKMTGNQLKEFLSNQESQFQSLEPASWPIQARALTTRLSDESAVLDQVNSILEITESSKSKGTARPESTTIVKSTTIAESPTIVFGAEEATSE